MDKLKAILYIRVSDPSQIENNSLETQLKSCRTYAENNNYEVVEIFREEGVSAKHIQTRPQMKRLLQFCTIKKNNISAIIIYKMDRWTRNVEEGLVAITLLSKYGVSVLPSSEIAEQTPIGKAMRTMLMTFGELENELKGERVRDNMKTMFRSGLWCWKPRMGYKRPYRSKEENKGLPPVISEGMGEMIKALFIKASENATNKKYLSNYLNSLGFKELYGKEADGRMVMRLLQDTFYYGYMYSPKWKEYVWGKHIPLVDQETWERANINVFGSKRKYKIQDSAIFPLKGVLLCSNCFRVMTSSNPKGTSKNYLYYECHTRKDRCKRRERIGIEAAHRDFSQLLASVRPSESVIKLFSFLVFSEWDKSIEQSSREAKIRDEQIKALEEKLTAIAESNAKHILTDEEAVVRAEKIRRDIAILRIERSDIRIEQYDTEAVKNFTEIFLIHLEKLWIQMELPQKQSLQAEIFPKGILINKGKIRTTTLASTFKLIGMLKGSNVDSVTPSVIVRNQVMPELIKYFKLFSPDLSRLYAQL